MVLGQQPIGPTSEAFRDVFKGRNDSNRLCAEARAVCSLLSQQRQENVIPLRYMQPVHLPDAYCESGESFLQGMSSYP
ncbi:hypothetical protein T10_326 [Trichinella papuae]|uniref:Uncharacterized protein n=1 Tax=Trichinella papuae TaxID=268474 RepID=A0A0V1MHI2_9BILA|nr:hypothetical protein T10_326 [Trichinella papuae]